MSHFGFWIVFLFMILIASLFFVLPLLKNRTSPYWLHGIVGGVFCLGAIGCYQHWGASKPLRDHFALKQVDEALSQLSRDDVTRQDILNKFSHLSKEYKRSAITLARIGGIYLELGFFQEAIQQYQQALVQDKNNQEYWVQWIYSYSLAHRGVLPKEVKEKAEQVLQKEKKNKTLINLLAIDDYFKKDYQKAIQGWQKLLKIDASLSDEQRLILVKAIHSAKQKQQTPVGEREGNNHDRK